MRPRHPPPTPFVRWGGNPRMRGSPMTLSSSHTARIRGTRTPPFARRTWTGRRRHVVRRWRKRRRRTAPDDAGAVALDEVRQVRSAVADARAAVRSRVPRGRGTPRARQSAGARVAERVRRSPRRGSPRRGLVWVAPGGSNGAPGTDSGVHHSARRVHWCCPYGRGAGASATPHRAPGWHGAGRPATLADPAHAIQGGVA